MNIKGQLLRSMFIILILLTSVNCKVQSTLFDIESITNENIKFSLLPRGKGGHVMLISVIGPKTAIDLTHSYNVDNLTNLLQVMDKDETKDWAINLIMYAIFNYDALELLKSKNNLAVWRKEKKSIDIELWKKYISEMDNG